MRARRFTVTPSAGLSLLLGLLTGGWGTGAKAQDLQEFLDQGSANLQVFALDTERGLQANSLLNPGNRIARLPRGQSELEARLDLKLGLDALELSVKPRARFEWFRFGSGKPETHLDAWLNQGTVTLYPAQSLTLSAGRDILTWGPSNFRSPSNPIYFENGRIIPLRELRGVDMAQATWSPTQALSVSLMHQWGDGRGGWQWDTDSGFKALSLLKVDYTADVYVASVNASKRWAHERPRFGAFAQTTVSDALLVYAEAGLRQGTPALYPESQPTAVGGAFLPRHATDGRRFYSALVGGSYTLNSGHTVSLEYLANNEGYRWADGARYFDIAARASALLTAPSPDAPLAGQTLGNALNNGLALLGRHYLFLQAQNNPADSGPIWQLRYSLNLVDGSGQVSAYGEWNVWERLALFAVGVLHHGSPRSEFHALQSRSILMGVKGYVL
ncbi:hypothetical protein [Comamonas sp. JC664]|uniref:hypothetical protein n=1 Tax=Comamonas sp. JC664 TaxID=2801917 RepID=UPI00191F4225|nr:hypothetical protein [Comamonas sp. JC664]MBL0694683.1 hypothetical protein [Comamonas sp. JC664]GHG93997.1 hypothetical protein GCM10012319_56600 [Comamonas sp. KCTC 72670]